MTLPALTPSGASGQTLTGNPLEAAGYVAASIGRVFHSAAAPVGRAVFILLAYRAALKRLEAGVVGDLFDAPVLWAELKSAAWAEAGAVAAARPKARPM